MRLGVVNQQMFEGAEKAIALRGLGGPDPDPGSTDYSPEDLQAAADYNASIDAPDSLGGGFSWASFADGLSKLVGAGSTAYRSTLQPSVVPGSNLVYDPRTGQFIPATGATLTSSLGNVGLGGISSGTLLLIGAALVAAVAFSGKR